MKWCRLYSEIIDDPKMAKLTADQFRHFILLLALATEREKDGQIDMDSEDVAWRLRVPIEDLQTTMSRLKELRILDNGYQNPVLVNWQKRQFKSDDSALRVKRHRDKHVKRYSNGDVTPRARAETETDTDTDTDTYKDKPSYSPPFLKFWSAYPRKQGKGAAWRSWQRIRGRPDVSVLIASIEKHQKTEQWQKDNGQFIPQATKWLNGRYWEDEPEDKNSARERFLQRIRKNGG